MKLKKSFLVKFLAACAFLFFSCESTNLSVPVPGQSRVKLLNIFVEYYNLGEAYFKLEDYKKASEYYELAMRQKDLYWAAYYKLAKCYAFTSDWVKALNMYKKLLERDPENTSLKASVAYIYSMQGDFNKAITIYEELLEIQPKSQDFLENYLIVLLADEKHLENENSQKYISAYDTLKTEYPENKNLKIFEEKYNKLIKKEESVS